MLPFIVYKERKSSSKKLLHRLKPKKNDQTEKLLTMPSENESK